MSYGKWGLCDSSPNVCFSLLLTLTLYSFGHIVAFMAYIMLLLTCLSVLPIGNVRAALRFWSKC